MGLPYEKGVSFGFIEKIILDSSIQTPLKMCLKKLKVYLLAVQCFFFRSLKSLTIPLQVLKLFSCQSCTTNRMKNQLNAKQSSLGSATK